MTSGGGEGQFWEGVAKSLSEGVSVETVAGGRATRADALADRDLFMYIVDTQHGWIRAGGYTRSDMGVALEVASQPRWVESVPLLTAELVHAAAEAGDDDHSPRVFQALGLGMAVAASSNCYGLVMRDRGDVAGHWFLFVYAALDGSLAWNASFAACDQRGFLSPHQIADMLKKVVGANLAVEMEVGLKMSVGGRVILSPMIERLLSSRNDQG